MNGAPKSFDHPHNKEEFDLDNRGLLRFRRITHPERGVFQPEHVVLHEYTGLPAVRCSDRSVRPGKKLSISYSQDRGKWYVTPSITLGEEGLPEFEHPLQLLFKPDVELSDAGLRDSAGGRERGLRARRGVQEDIVWLDVESLLLRESSDSFTMEGKRLELVSPRTSSAGGQLSRPTGVQPPDCL